MLWWVPCSDREIGRCSWDHGEKHHAKNREFWYLIPGQEGTFCVGPLSPRTSIVGQPMEFMPRPWGRTHFVFPFPVPQFHCSLDPLETPMRTIVSELAPSLRRGHFPSPVMTMTSQSMLSLHKMLLTNEIEGEREGEGAVSKYSGFGLTLRDF